MFPKHKPFYHPYPNSSFGLLVNVGEPLNAQAGWEINNVDLYYQPVQEPVAGTTFFFLKLVIVLLGGFIHSKILKLMSKESSIIDDITKFYLWNQIITYPTGLVFVTITDFIHPASEYLGYWFCTVGWFYFAFSSYITIFFSFAVSMMRYLFILHNKKVEKFGKAKMKKLFMVLFISIPALCVLFESFEEFHLFSYINKCYGKDHKMFLIETSTLKILTHKFWIFDSNNTRDIWPAIIETTKKICKLIRQAFMIIMGCNISEAIIYYKVLSHMNR